MSGGGQLLRRIWELISTMSTDFRDYLAKRDEREKVMNSALDRALFMINEQRNRIISLEAQLTDLQAAGVLFPHADYQAMCQREDAEVERLKALLKTL